MQRIQDRLCWDRKYYLIDDSFDLFHGFTCCICSPDYEYTCWVFLQILEFICFFGTNWSPHARELGVTSSSRAHSFNTHNLNIMCSCYNYNSLSWGCIIVGHGWDGPAVGMMFLFCRAGLFANIITGDVTLSLMCVDEILAYRYVKPRDQWFLTEETPRPTLPWTPGGSGAIPIEYAHVHPQTEKPVRA